MVLGSDYPFPLGEHHPGKLIESIDGFSQETKVSLQCSVCAIPYCYVSYQDKLLHHNVLQFLGLDKAKFGPVQTTEEEEEIGPPQTKQLKVA